MKTIYNFVSVSWVILVGLSSLSSAEPVQLESKSKTLSLAGIFGDHMVFQQNRDVAIWGRAKAGAVVSVEVSWSSSVVKTTTGHDGKWKLKVKTPKAGVGFNVKVKSGGKEIELKNVASGEVWVCSGQSNMQWKMRGFGVDHFKEDVQKAKFPEIRFCDVPQVLSLKEEEEVKARWSVCNPKSTLQFSAVAYFFGSKLHQELKVPIGLISTNWGGSALEGWVSSQVLEKKLENYKVLTKDYHQWINKEGSRYSRSAKKPKGLNQSSPSVLYNSMLKPLMPFNIRGVIWYQGESNTKRPIEYRTLFPAMIQDWRKGWGIGEFPFYYVQIAPFAYKRDPLPAAMLREAQTMALAEPNTGMVVTMDVGDVGNIHPKKKKPVGERLALLALSRDYGRSTLVASGPLLKDFKIKGDKVYLSFSGLGSGLVSRDGKPLTHFTIAGVDQKFVSAEAEIVNDHLVVSSNKVSKPKSVRFGWGNADRPNLMNKEGLPASSFRTDRWAIKAKK